MSHQGQWIGQVGGDSPGLAVCELDEREGLLDGIVYLFPENPEQPSVCAYLAGLEPQSGVHNITARLFGVDPAVGYYLNPEETTSRFPDYVLPETAGLQLTFHGRTLSLSYQTAITSGRGDLFLSNADQQSQLVPSSEVRSWAEFKTWAVQQRNDDLIYRGQPVTKRLRTSFHRTKRKNLARFRDNDINELRRHLAPRLRHVFNPMSTLETGALYNLAQHHGYPTPLLAGTAPPFVAAFFAYRPRAIDRHPADQVRIFVFDRVAWHRSYAASALVAYTQPHFSVIDLLPIENQRALPQQATATITNIDDIEGHITAHEQHAGRSFLTAINLPVWEREQGLAELNLMGINAGSLFPGLDGACEALAYKNFGV